MCLAVPGRVLSVSGNSACVDFGGVKSTVRVDLLQDIAVGQYVLVHVGFAIQALDSAEARETIAQLEAISEKADKDRA